MYSFWTQQKMTDPLVNKRIFLDMDGVMVDFEAWMAEVGLPIGVNDDKLWEEIQKVDHFFLNLKPMKDYLLLWDYLWDNQYDVEILTAVPSDKHNVKTAEED